MLVRRWCADRFHLETAMDHCVWKWAMASVLFAFGHDGVAQEPLEAVKLTPKITKEGEAVLVVRKERATTSVKIRDAAGKLLGNTNETITEDEEYVETMLKREGKERPTKVER